jgi:hypothetical protein
MPSLKSRLAASEKVSGNVICPHPTVMTFKPPESRATRRTVPA